VLKPIQPNYEGNLFIPAYNSLFLGTSKLNRDEGIGILHDDYALYTFGLTANLGDDDHFNLLKHGNLCLVLKFGEPLTETATEIAFRGV